MVNNSDSDDKEKKFSVELDRLKQMSIESLNSIITMIDDNKLTDSDKIEFFDTYEDDIIEMLENKIKDIRGDKK